MEPRIQVLVAEPGLKNYGRGVRVIARALRGIIPDEDASRLNEPGAAVAIQPGASLESVVSFIHQNVHLEEVRIGN